MNKTIGLALLAAILLLGGALSAWTFLQRGPAEPAVQFDGDPFEINEIDHIWGTDTAAVTLIKYSDFQCPACASAHAVLSDIKTDYPDDFRLIYRHYIVTQPHQRSRDASSASIAAAAQEAFWEMHDLIFERQQNWRQDEDARATFFGYAEELGLDMERFSEDFANAGGQINRHMQSGRALGVRGTPTLFLNGEVVPMWELPNFEAFRELIEQALRQQL